MLPVCLFLTAIKHVGQRNIKDLIEEWAKRGGYTIDKAESRNTIPVTVLLEAGSISIVYLVKVKTPEGVRYAYCFCGTRLWALSKDMVVMWDDDIVNF